MGALLFPLICGSSAFASQAPPEFSGEYVVLFSVKGGKVLSDLTENENPMAQIVPGKVYSPEKLDQILAADSPSDYKADHNTDIQQALFEDAQLVLNFFEASTEFSKQFEIADCNKLNIEHGSELIDQAVVCDNRTYSLKVNGSSIDILSDSDVIISFDLGDESFTLNGTSFPR